MQQPFTPTRRQFVQLGLTAMACAVTAPALAAIPHMKGVRELAFYNLHTEEHLRADYWRNGKYNRAQLAKINHLLRDHYSGDVHPMDVRLIDLLHDLQHKVGNHGVIEVVSGYRSPKTNMQLAKVTDGIARRSFHTQGKAIDLRMPGTPLPKIHNAALEMDRGGVGFYPDSHFVHLDTGPTSRMW